MREYLVWVFETSDSVGNYILCINIVVLVLRSRSEFFGGVAM